MDLDCVSDSESNDISTSAEIDEGSGSMGQKHTDSIDKVTTTRPSKNAKECVVPKPQRKVYDHVDRTDCNARSFSPVILQKSWTLTENAFTKSGSITSNQMKHVKTKHKKEQLQGPGDNNKIIGPMDSFVHVSEIEISWLPIQTFLRS
jgi:hypothetical protein